MKNIDICISIRNVCILNTDIWFSKKTNISNLEQSMASRFTIYSINQISDLMFQISYKIYKISDMLYKIYVK